MTNSTISSKDYYSEVNELAQTIFDEVMQENDNDVALCEDDGLFYDRLHETIDGHQWIIYNHYNLQVLRHASNPEEMIDQMGAEAAGESLKEGGLSTLHTHLAFWALQADVSNKLQEIISDYEPEENEED